MNLIKDFEYDPIVFINNFNERKFKYDDSILNSTVKLNTILNSLKKHRIVVENKKGNRKILILDYKIKSGIKILFFDDFYGHIVNINNSSDQNFSIDKDLYNLSELKIKDDDEMVRILYFSIRTNKYQGKVLISNWLNLK